MASWVQWIAACNKASSLAYCPRVHFAVLRRSLLPSLPMELASRDLSVPALSLRRVFLQSWQEFSVSPSSVSRPWLPVVWHSPSAESSWAAPIAPRAPFVTRRPRVDTSNSTAPTSISFRGLERLFRDPNWIRALGLVSTPPLESSTLSLYVGDHANHDARRTTNDMSVD